LVRRYRSGALEVTVDRPLAGVPPHWHRGGDAASIVLGREVPIAVLVEGAGSAPSPCPALVMFGLDDDAELYVDLEALGLVTLEGAADAVAAIARAVVATLAVSPLADLVHVVASGVDCYGFANEERVQCVSDPDAALDLAAPCRPGSAMPSATAAPTTSAALARGAVGAGRRHPVADPAHPRAADVQHLVASGAWPWSPTPTCPAPATGCGRRPRALAARAAGRHGHGHRPGRRRAGRPRRPPG
jgi:hypothetical protein